ncbi:DNA translocase FtsK [Chelatococcus reniformis]|uniref:FtsK domain-containing protein n=1 Tax=Chelatococcus reniformis TaxID=1494448 RepID=A0A916UQP9_9HYPH|nr:DNA translocase FtsK [Chelatococcus reniformis]GGC82181.1 hypothetical protein GCM10010994_45130 [Chelatococcus reniformis]
MSSWNRPPYPLASVFVPAASSGSEARVTVSTWMDARLAQTWFSPFSVDKNTRFTRTPDVFMRPPVPEPEALPPPPARIEPAHAEEAADTAPDEADAFEDDDVVLLADDEIEEAFAALAAADERFGFDEDTAAAARAAEPDAGAPPMTAEEGAAPDEPAPAAAAMLAGLLGRLRTEPAEEDAAVDAETRAGLDEAWADELLEEAAAAAADDGLVEWFDELFGDPAHDLPVAPSVARAEEPAAQPAEAATVTEEPVAVRLAGLPPAIRRLGSVIMLAPAVPPVAAPEQDLIAPPAQEEPDVEAAALEGEAAVCGAEAEEELDAAVDAAGLIEAARIVESLSDDADDEDRAEAAFDSLPAVDDAAAWVEDEDEEAAEPDQDAAPTAAPFAIAIASPVRASFGWPVFAVPAALPAEWPAAAGEDDGAAALEAADDACAHNDSIDDDFIADDLTSSDFTTDGSDDADEQDEEPGYRLPPLTLLTEPPELEPAFEMSEEFLDRNSATLQQTLWDFGVRGEVIDANPGPVVTLYEFEPAPGTKSSRVIGLSADIARSMSAISTRVAVVEGRNVIGIELPNQRRETVWLRELLASHAFTDASGRLGICLGKTIGGEPVIVDLARMPHLLVAGTTGSGKSVAINTMILSLLYRLSPEQCRLIMIDPKMLELSVYEGIPHLLTPVVTDPKKAIIALQWAVREMEERYRKMSRLKVRNIEGFNARVAEARRTGEVITTIVDTGFDKETGEILREEVTLDLTSLPYIVIIVDEMADLMMVAGKDIEGAIQRLAQMARAAGIHLVMATQRPSVDVITGTIKANFPTRISFQVTSKIDSRTILGEMGAETLLGQGDMLYMASGGRITRVHGPFVSDNEVEKVVAHLKAQGRPEYLEAVTSEDGEEEVEDDTAVFDKSPLAAEDGADHYEQAVAVVLRDRKASTSYIQRRLQIGYNRAASLMERMENEGIVGPANHAGKREILANRAG